MNARVLSTLVAAVGLALGAAPAAAQVPACGAPANPVVAENCLRGNPASEWEVEGGGDPSIQGFATDISVDQGQAVGFKVETTVTDYRLDIYRMGWYGGAGARRVATVQPSAALPQNQPDCVSDSTTGLIDCGNWAPSASWTVPGNAVSGIYLARLVREDGPAGASHVPFVVRDDDGRSDLLFQTGDTTWQAYNRYGGNSLYVGGPGTNPGRAYKVSYNRPFTTREYAPEDWLFNAEYPMVRWLERNGYDVSYFTGVDSDRRGSEIREHGAFLSVGHDEYWSGAQRANVEAARGAGVHLAFFSGNEVFWKTRWESSHRTLVSYKETHANAKIDPCGRLDGHVARSALQPAGRRRPAGERPYGAAVHGQRRRHHGHSRPGGRRQDASVAQHERRGAGHGRDRDVAERNTRLRVGRGRRQRPPPARFVPPVEHDRAERPRAGRLRLKLRL